MTKTRYLILTVALVLFASFLFVGAITKAIWITKLYFSSAHTVTAIEAVAFWVYLAGATVLYAAASIAYFEAYPHKKPKEVVTI